MSKYRAYCYLIVDSVPHANQIINSITSVFQANTAFSLVDARLDKDDDERPKVETFFEYNSLSDRDNIKDWLATQRVTVPVKNWIITGWLSWKRWDQGFDIKSPEAEYGEFSF